MHRRLGGSASSDTGSSCDQRQPQRRPGARSSVNQRDESSIWRKRRDSNPRYAFTYTHFPGVRLKPLGHPSAGGGPYISRRTGLPPEFGAHYSQSAPRFKRLLRAAGWRSNLRAYRPFPPVIRLAGEGHVGGLRPELPGPSRFIRPLIPGCKIRQRFARTICGFCVAASSSLPGSTGD